jgi:hypothetical protein
MRRRRRQGFMKDIVAQNVKPERGWELMSRRKFCLRVNASTELWSRVDVEQVEEMTTALNELPS